MFPHGELWMRHERLFLSISTLPWGYGELRPDKLLQSGMGMHSLLLLMERWSLHVVKTCSRKNHKLQHVLYLLVSNAADHQPHTCGYLFNEMWAYFTWASYCVVLFSIAVSLSLFTLEHSVSIMLVIMKNKLGNFYLCCLLWSWWWQNAFSPLFLGSVLHCVPHIWNWIHYLLSVTVFVLPESTDREVVFWLGTTKILL